MRDFFNCVYVFIDASNLWQAQKSKGRLLDYRKTIGFIREKFSAQTVRTFYYDAYPGIGTREYPLDGKHQFYTFLKKGLNFEVRKKKLKRIIMFRGQDCIIQEKGNMDVELTIDAVHYSSRFNISVFFTGDSDFIALVSYLRRRGKKVYIFSSRNNISEELRTGSDGYEDILKVNKDIWGKDLVKRGRDGE